jgi:hypothetical protein
MIHPFIQAITRRRTQYSLGKSLPLSNTDVAGLIEDAIRHAPSSYNSQSSRAVILFGDHSTKLWSIAKETLRKSTDPEAFPRTEARLNGFAAGAGTVLFYEDQETIRRMQAKYARIADRFAEFSEHSSGMAQFAVWSALANAGIGASLQHYNPLIDAQVAATWEIDPDWRLRSQMPFGSNEAPFSGKTFIDDALRFKVYGE